MTARANIRRVGIGAVLPLVLIAFSSFVRADELKPTKQSISLASDLRKAAEEAEKIGDWDAAFTAYCHLFVADRASPDVREKLNVALRHAQQLARHRDPRFQQFANTTSVSDAIKLFGEVVTKVPAWYVDRDRATPAILWRNAVEELARALGNPTFQRSFIVNAAPDKLNEFRKTLRVKWAKEAVANAVDAKTTLRQLIADAQESFAVRVPAALAIEMVCGACSGIDEYTVFLNPATSAQNPMTSVPDISAQGVYLEIVEDELLIAGIAPGSWADCHTPLRKGDRIVMLNDKSMEMATLHGAAEALRLRSEGFHALQVDPVQPVSPELAIVNVQLPVTVPSLYHEQVVASKDGIAVGYARLGSFAQTTPAELDDAIGKLKSQGAQSLVLDLRGNMGGSFPASVETVKRLLPTGLIVTTQGQLAEVANRPFSSDSGMSANDIPVVVLVDAETASAAEVMAAALQFHKRAVLIGMPTFGKGAIQYPFALESLDGVDEHGKPRATKSGGVRLTIAKLIAPHGGPISGVGVTPDILEADPEGQLRLAVEKAAELLPMMPRPMPMP